MSTSLSGQRILMQASSEAEESVLGPFSSARNAGSDSVHCAQCGGWWALEAIRGVGADGATRPWAEVRLPVDTGAAARRRGLLGNRRRQEGGRSTAKRAEILAQAYEPFCPRSHRLASSAQRMQVVGVIGPVGSSKSHYLAGAVYELLYEQQLAGFDMDLAYRDGHGGSEMESRINDVYTNKAVLPVSEMGSVSGPYTYRLTRDASIGSEAESVDLVFFDVAGEDCMSKHRSAGTARHLFDAEGVVLLIDPDGLPSPGRPLEPRGGAPLASRAIVDNLADAMEEIHGRSAREQGQTVVIAIAKADSANLPPDVWPPEVWPHDGDAEVDAEGLRKRLRGHSDKCRAFLERNGGRGIVAAARNRFGTERVYYAAVSATGEAPTNGSWQAPRPIGCSIPIAQILCLGVDYR